MSILDEVNFGPHYFEIALLLRESMLINGITTNAEIWYNFTQNEVQEFENLDKLFLRRIPNTLNQHQPNLFIWKQ